MKRMKSSLTRWLAAILSVIMLTTMMPGNAWGAETVQMEETYAEPAVSEESATENISNVDAPQEAVTDAVEAVDSEPAESGTQESESAETESTETETSESETTESETTESETTESETETSESVMETETTDESETEIKEIIPELELSQTSFVYNGEMQKPDVLVKDGDTVIDEENYSLLYEADSVDAGTYKVSVELKGDYAGENTASYEIVAKAITPTVTLSQTSFVYNGKEQKPAVTVADGVTTLESSDYTVTYANGRINVGTYKVTVRMKGNYSGTKAVNYKITAKAITPAVTLSKTSFVYNGKVQKPSVTVKTGSTKLTTADYTVTYSTGCKNVGAYKVTIKMRRNYSGSKSVTFKILPKGTALSTVKAGKNRMVVSWKKQATQTTGYHIQYSAKSDFSKALTATVASNATLSRSISSKECQDHGWYYRKIRKETVCFHRRR